MNVGRSIPISPYEFIWAKRTDLTDTTRWFFFKRTTNMTAPNDWFYTIYMLDAWAEECKRTSDDLYERTKTVAAALLRLHYGLSRIDYREELDGLHERDIEQLDEQVSEDSYDGDTNLYNRPDDIPEKDVKEMLHNMLKAKVHDAEQEAIGSTDNNKAFWKTRQADRQLVLDVFDKVFKS
jgi:hypothetical protein